MCLIVRGVNIFRAVSQYIKVGNKKKLIAIAMHALSGNDSSIINMCKLSCMKYSTVLFKFPFVWHDAKFNGIIFKRNCIFR